MGRQLNRLTARFVETKKQPGLYCDGGGLYLQISPAGSKAWIFRYRSPLTGKLRNMGLGACGKPAALRCDNGPENISQAIRDWAKDWGIRFDYIQPGKPQQNAYVERFKRTVRYEWLSQYYWESLDEVQRFATHWMWHYNHNRPNMALDGFTPKQRLAMAA